MLSDETDTQISILKYRHYLTTNRWNAEYLKQNPDIQGMKARHTRPLRLQSEVCSMEKIESNPVVYSVPLQN